VGILIKHFSCAAERFSAQRINYKSGPFVRLFEPGRYRAERINHAGRWAPALLCKLAQNLHNTPAGGRSNILNTQTERHRACALNMHVGRQHFRSPLSSSSWCMGGKLIESRRWSWRRASLVSDCGYYGLFAARTQHTTTTTSSTTRARSNRPWLLPCRLRPLTRPHSRRRRARFKHVINKVDHRQPQQQ